MMVMKEMWFGNGLCVERGLVREVRVKSNDEKGVGEGRKNRMMERGLVMREM